MTSQGNVEIFDLLFKLALDLFRTSQHFRELTTTSESIFASVFKRRINLGNYSEPFPSESRESSLPESRVFNLVSVRKALVDCQDVYGNALLHLAVLNNKKDMYDRLVRMGASTSTMNNDGLTPFTLAARYGIWSMFNHIWDKHMSQVIWKFGNVTKISVDTSSFDQKGLIHFSSKREAKLVMNLLLGQYNNLGRQSDILKYLNLNRDPEIFADFECKLQHVELLLERLDEETCQKKLVARVRNFYNHSDDAQSCEEDFRQDKDAMSAIRLITLFRPKNWYEMTSDKVEKTVLHKWSQGFHLVHLGQNVLPYCFVLLLFGLMWLYRQLNILEHNFWWADHHNTSPPKHLGSDSSMNPTFLTNPVVANLSELAQEMKKSVFGSSLSNAGLLPDQIGGPESTCGWSAIRNSRSGALQACLVIYGVPALLRLAYTQRRIRPSDLDESEDMKISYDELVNFIYFNLESLVHIVMCALLLTIGSARVLAGDACTGFYLEMEKQSTAIASLFLFLNLFIVCKPYKGIGVLVLTIYKFLVSDVFTFLIMYSIFFAAYLLALQSLHNANHIYLAWIDYTSRIVPQVQLLTHNATILYNENLNQNVDQLQQTYMMLDACNLKRHTIADTAFSLLEISFGDGLADALEQARGHDYECAGFMADPLLSYILVFWVFLTNVLVLNMLIAIMNFRFHSQLKEVHCVWLLDVSYRIIRYEGLFPELTDRIQTPVAVHSFWSLGYWESRFWDACLTLYCIPEIHMWGFSNRLVQMIPALICNKYQPRRLNSIPWIETKESIIEEVVLKWPEYVYPTRNWRQSLNTLKQSRIRDKLTSLCNSRTVTGKVDIWCKLMSNPESDEVRSLLLLISLIHHLDSLLRSYDSSRAMQLTMTDNANVLF